MMPVGGLYEIKERARKGERDGERERKRMLSTASAFV